MTYEEKYYEKANKNEDNKSSLRNAVDEFLTYNAKKGESILEVGCGSGILIPHLPQGVVYMGVDSSTYGLEQARARFKDATFIEASSEKLPFNQDTFSYVVSIFALEHFSKPKESLDEMVRVLKPGGHLLLLAPNLEFPFARLNALRHRSFIYRVGFMAMRIRDYLFRVFGVLTFRTIQKNYTEATGRYEKPDDDLRYAVSTFEVIAYLQSRYSMKLVAGGTPVVGTGWRATLRKLIQFLPAMRYYGGVLFIVMQK
jgi:ubiquinone/menaquinone biosynthesis C-methylase UbiE